MLQHAYTTDECHGTKAASSMLPFDDALIGQAGHLGSTQEPCHLPVVLDTDSVNGLFASASVCAVAPDDSPMLCWHAM